MRWTLLAVLVLVPLLVGDSPAQVERECPSGTTQGTWTESLFTVSATVQGCVSGDGRRIGSVVVTDGKGREILSGGYTDGLRHGPWTIQIFADGPESSTSERMEFWFDGGVNRAIEGGRLTALASARVDVPNRQAERGVGDQPEIKVLAVERLISGWCDGCPAYAVEIHRDGRVDYVGYSAVEPLGPHCGRLESEYVGTILRLAARANLPSLESNYYQPVTHAGRLIVLVKATSFEKLVNIEGPGSPVELFDLSRVIELAIPRVDWDCAEESGRPR